jgi:hypothetical protein
VAYHQRAHIDMDNWGIIIHMPLCREGMMLYVWPENNKRMSTGQYIHVPFGSFLAMPAHTVHSGVYGSDGNIQFHLLIRERESKWLVDKLHDDVEE